MERVNNNRSFFNDAEQKAVINKNIELTEKLKTATNVVEWNKLREEVKHKFVGNQQQRAMLFGYIDGVIHPEVFGK